MDARPLAKDLVRAAMLALGVTTDDALRDELRRRYGLSPSQGTVNRWRNGGREPSYENTIALLDAAGWLNTSGVRRKAQPDPGDPLVVLEAKVDVMAHATADSLERLEAGMKELSARIQPADGRRRKAG